MACPNRPELAISATLTPVHAIVLRVSSPKGLCEWISGRLREQAPCSAGWNWHAHGVLASNTYTCKTGSGSVFINGKAHRKGDDTKHCGGMGSMTSGSGDVITGG